MHNRHTGIKPEMSVQKQLVDRDDARPTPARRVAANWWGYCLSFLVHLGLLVATAMVAIPRGSEAPSRELRLAQPVEQEVVVAKQFRSDWESDREVGATDMRGEEAMLAHATVLSPVAEIPRMALAPTDVSEIPLPRLVETAMGPHTSELQPVKGIAGYGTQGALGAIDRLTHEILLSLQERPTLVVWLFDQSASLHQQRQTIRDRFDRIYEELGIVAERGHAGFERTDEPPLLSAVVAFGQKVTTRTKKPTDDLALLKSAIDSIELDDSGIELAFTAVIETVRQHRAFRKIHPRTNEPTRNVMLILVTDEAADDQARMDEAVKICRPLAIPVYAVGVPAPFGRVATHMKWVDPDRNFDQTPGWGLVHQGPESYFPERLRIGSEEMEQPPDPLDSGFGPFALTRLCVESGGMYFSVHPNRQLGRTIGAGETDAYASYLRHFFDPEIMRKYQPHYGSIQEHERLLRSHPCLAALVKAARHSWVTPIVDPTLRFVKIDDAQLSRELTVAQRKAASLEPEVDQILDLLETGESSRDQETQARVQAGFDLAMGQALALKVRTGAYNAMLALAKRGQPFPNPAHNTWQLQPADEIPAGSPLQKLSEKARFYLQRVVDEHPQTPWALIAHQELRQPLGWRWLSDFTPQTLPDLQVAIGTPAPPRDDQRRMLAPPPPRREVPRL